MRRDSRGEERGGEAEERGRSGVGREGKGEGGEGTDLQACRHPLACIDP